MDVIARTVRKTALGIVAASAFATVIATAASAQTVPPSYDGKDANYKIMIGSNLRAGEKLTDKIAVTLWQGGEVRGIGRCTDQACPVNYNGQDLWARRSRLSLISPGAGGVPPPGKPTMKEVIKDKMEGIIGKPNNASSMQITRILRRGDQGDDVRFLQDYLNSKFGARLEVDGVYGRGTKGFIADFQKSKGLQPDGNTGPQTLTALGL